MPVPPPSKKKKKAVSYYSGKFLNFKNVSVLAYPLGFPFPFKKNRGKENIIEKEKKGRKGYEDDVVDGCYPTPVLNQRPSLGVFHLWQKRKKKIFYLNSSIAIRFLLFLTACERVYKLGRVA